MQRSLDLYPEAESPPRPTRAVIEALMADVYALYRPAREANHWYRKALAVRKVCPADPLALEVDQASQTLRHWRSVLRAAKKQLGDALCSTGVPHYEGGGYRCWYRLDVRPDGREHATLLVRNVASEERAAEQRRGRAEAFAERNAAAGIG